MSEHLVAFVHVFTWSGELWVGIVGALIAAAQLALMLADRRRGKVPLDVRAGHGLNEPQQRRVKRRRRRARGRRR